LRTNGKFPPESRVDLKGDHMSIWKELTNPSSFAGEFDTAVEAPVTNNAAPGPNRIAANTSKVESVIGPGIVFEGNLGGHGDLRIGGQVNGDISLKGDLTLSGGARISGSVSANSVTIGGQLEGNIQAPGHVRLLETGQLIGDVKAKFLMAALGSRMRGHVEFGWDEPQEATAERRSTAAANGAQPARNPINSEQ
jgi:cytoskeletal protein CcmA (bactofilin family)